MNKLLLIPIVLLFFSCSGDYTTFRKNVLSPIKYISVGEGLEFLLYGAYGVSDKCIVSEYKKNGNNYKTIGSNDTFIFKVQGQNNPININYIFKITKVEFFDNDKRIVVINPVEKKFSKYWYFEETSDNLNTLSIPNQRQGSITINKFKFISQYTLDDDLGSYSYHFQFDDVMLISEDFKVEIFFTEGDSAVQSVILETSEVIEKREYVPHNKDILRIITP